MKIKQKNELRILMVYPNLAMMLVPSIAIGLFTKILKREGYALDLFDTTHYVSDENSSPQNRVKYLQARNFKEKEDLGVKIKTDLLGDFRKKVLEFQPDLLLMSVVEDAFLQAVKMLEVIQDLQIPHLMGGVFPTASAQRCMDFSVIRAVGLGEGENTVVEFAEAIRLNKSLEDVSGIWFKDSQGNIHKNHQAPLVNLDMCRPDFSLFEEARFFRPMGGRIFKTIPVETYRGCPYACSYCNSPMQKNFASKYGLGNFLRRKSMQALHSEISELKEIFSPEFFYFIDDSFLARPQEEINEFCEMYSKFKLPFWFNTRPENCTLENMQQVKDAGCYRISFGIECGNEEFRKKILNRNVSNAYLIDKFKLIAESGISFSINLIIGFPGETRALVMDTVEFVRSIYGYDTLTVSMFTPYHGTVLRDVAIKNGWLDNGSITKHTTAQSMLNMSAPYLSVDELDGLMRVLPLYCYFPKDEWKNIFPAEKNDEEGNRVLGYYGDIYKEKFLKFTQEEMKDFVVDGAAGCRVNPKDAFRISPSRLSLNEIEMLTLKGI
ncbi:MAG: radical SAM protein [Candidatus Omnitrophica bacterium]|nr:radical SAM protein [Candidatus Omnitrophota bacterium]